MNKTDIDNTIKLIQSRRDMKNNNYSNFFYDKYISELINHIYNSNNIVIIDDNLCIIENNGRWDKISNIKIFKILLYKSIHNLKEICDKNEDIKLLIFDETYSKEDVNIIKEIIYDLKYSNVIIMKVFDSFNTYFATINEL